LAKTETLKRREEHDMARNVNWAWSDVAGGASRVSSVLKPAKASKTAKSEPQPEPHQQHTDLTESAKPAQKAGKGRKAKTSAPSAAEVPVDLPPAEDRQGPLAALAKIAEREGWTIDEAMCQAIDALSRHLDSNT
jgi:hypothetical protein